MSVVVEFTSDEAKLFRGMQKLINQQGKLEGKFRKTGSAGKKAGDDVSRGFGSKGLGDLKRFVGGVVSVGAAIGVASKSYDLFIKNSREAGRAAEGAFRSVVAFAALQEGGNLKSAVLKARELGQRFGVTDQGQVFSVVQSLQSVRGSLKEGLEAAKIVFSAPRIGITVEDALETELLGAGQGQKPGQALRRVTVAGQASGRSPAELAKAAPALSFFEDKDFGVAAAAVLAGRVPAEQLRTVVQALGVALGPTASPDFRKFLEDLGAKEGDTKLSKLKLLFDANIRTDTQLGNAGVKELLRSQALLGVLNQFPALLKIRDQIKEKAVPGLITGLQSKIESELPQVRINRELDIARAKSKDLQSFGPSGIAGQREELASIRRGNALRERGIESFGPFGLPFFDAVDEEGRTTRVRNFARRLFQDPGSLVHGGRPPKGQLIGEGLLPPASAVAAEDSRIDAILTKWERATENLAEATSKLRGGATGVLPLEDK